MRAPTPLPESAWRVKGDEAWEALWKQERCFTTGVAEVTGKGRKWKLFLISHPHVLRDLPFLDEHCCLVDMVCACLLSCSVASNSPDSLGPLDYTAHQAPLSMEFSRQEYWSGLLLPSPEALPYPGTEPASLALTGRLFTTEPPGKSLVDIVLEHIAVCFNFSSRDFKC